jgi:hypothetical protein
MHLGRTMMMTSTWLPAPAGFPFWNIEMWDKKEVFAGVLTAGRVAKVAFDKAGVPAQVLYHNHANLVSAASVLQTALNILQSQSSFITPWPLLLRIEEELPVLRMCPPPASLQSMYSSDDTDRDVVCLRAPAGQPASGRPHAAGEGPGAAGGLPLPRLRRLPHAGGLLQGATQQLHELSTRTQ